MTPENAVAIGREAIMTLLIVSAPLLVVGFLVGLLVSLVQAVMQLHEVTIAFVPKIAAMAIALILVASWMLHKLSMYTTFILTHFPELVNR